MTIVSSGPISIQSLRNEYHAGGGATDLAHYGNLVLGRANCSLSEFYGRSNAPSELKYGPFAKPGWPPDSDTPWVFATAWGTVTTQHSARDSLNYYAFLAGTGAGAAAWPKFIRLETPHGNYGPGSFAPSGSTFILNAAGSPVTAGNVYWVFNP